MLELRYNFRAWLLVAVMFIALGLAFTGRASLPVLINSWSTDFGWSVTFLASGGSVIMLVMAISAPMVGYLLDRFGPRYIVSNGLILSGLAISSTSFMTTKGEFLIIFCITAAVGYGVVSIPIAAATIARKFEKNRGFASSLGMAGVGGGQAFFLPIIAWSIMIHGWRAALMMFGCGLIITGLLSIFCMDNTLQVSETSGDKKNKAKRVRDKLLNVFRSKIFWLLGSAYIICGFTTAGIVKVHFVPFLKVVCGFSLNDSAMAYGIMALFDAVGLIVAGALSDRVHRPFLLGTVYFLRALTFLMLFFVSTEYWILLLFAIFFGTLDFATVPLNAGLVADHLGLHSMGLTMGLLFAGHSIGGALGSFLGGVVYDYMASYDWVWITGLAFAFVAAFLAWSVPESTRYGDK